MKPEAPPLSTPPEGDDEPSIQSAVKQLCVAEERHARITIPAPPSPETLRAATPCPPPNDEPSLDTIPAPPPSSITQKNPPGSDTLVDSAPSTIPGPPRVPRIA